MHIEQLLPQFIDIPAGAFPMGTPDDERSALSARYGGTRESYAEESPRHQAQVGFFRIARTPVSNALWLAFVQDTGAHRPINWGVEPAPEQGDHPVVDISWDDAQLFCGWLRDRTGSALRLPTEAEWEKAARGGDGRRFPWGDAFDLTRCNVRESALGATTPAGAYPAGASPYGVLDMAGNVWEWTQSLQAAYPYAADDGRNGAKAQIPRRLPRILQRLVRQAPEHMPPPVELRRVLRGGCWANPSGFARCACRLRLAPDKRTPFVGLRLACD